MEDEFYDSFESSDSDTERQYEQEQSLQGTSSTAHYTDQTGYAEDPAATPEMPVHRSLPGDTSQQPVTSAIKRNFAPSPKFSPRGSKRKFPHFKKPQGLGNFTDKIKKRKKRVFGTNLQVAVERSELGTDGLELPTIFRLCIDYLEENALDHQGLYRLAGVKSQVEGVKLLFDKGILVDLSEYDPNTVASLLKLYLRELPEPLIPLKSIPKYELAATQTPSTEMQVAVFKLLLQEVPYCNVLLLGWLLEHMSHIAAKSDINKMGISNLVIVFSPSLQIPVPVMHALYNVRYEIFPDLDIRKYTRPQTLPDPDSFETEEEISAELTRLNEVLDKFHSSEGRYHDEREEIQRLISELKRKKKVLEKMSGSKLVDEQEFMKTLMVMEATLQLESQELQLRNKALKSAIRKEAELIEQFNSQIKLLKSQEVKRVEGESDNQTELCQTIANLRWKKKELELEYNNLVAEIEKEEASISQLKVKLKIAPFEQSIIFPHSNPT